MPATWTSDDEVTRKILPAIAESGVAVARVTVRELGQVAANVESNGASAAPELPAPETVQTRTPTNWKVLFVRALAAQAA